MLLSYTYKLEKKSIAMFKKEVLGYGYVRNNLAQVGEHATYGDFADMSDLFYFDFVFI